MDGRQCNNQPNKRGLTRSKAGRREATQQPAKLERHNKRRMREKRRQLNKRGGCLLRGCGVATEGGGLMRGGGAGGWEATRQPAKQEMLDKKQSRQMGGYTTTSHIRGAHQEADAQKEAAAQQEGGCLLRGGGAVTEGGGSMSAVAPADGRQRDNQPNERGTTIGGASEREAMQQPAK